MVRIIINADDCGLNPEVNAAIDHALAVNAISSTTILANSKYLDEVHRMVERHPNASFGIHLNITEGESLTKSEVLFKYGVTDSNGRFVKGNSKRCSNPSDELKNAIKEEWNAQLQLLTKDGFILSHVDGHHHCHTWPGLEGVLVELMKQYGLTKTRNRYYSPSVTFGQKVKSNVLHILVPVSNIVPMLRRYTKKIILFNNYNHCLKSNAVVTTDYFGGYAPMSSRLKCIVKEECLIELMCHPGSSLYKREEQDILQDEIGLNKGIYQLVSYNDI